MVVTLRTSRKLSENINDEHWHFQYGRTLINVAVAFGIAETWCADLFSKFIVLAQQSWRMRLYRS